MWVMDAARILRCCGSGVATALVGPLAWEPPYATGAAQEMAKKTKKKKKKERKKERKKLYRPERRGITYSKW